MPELTTSVRIAMVGWIVLLIAIVIVYHMYLDGSRRRGRDARAPNRGGDAQAPNKRRHS